MGLINDCVINNGGLIISGETLLNDFDRPIHTVEKDNSKILLYELIGLNKEHIEVKKEFVNKTKQLYLTIKGEYKDEVTGWENDINIKLNIDYKIYDEVSWGIKDGILTITLYEICNEEPDVAVSELI